MSQAETRLQRRIVSELQRGRCYSIRQRLQGRRGWPDIYAILPCGHPCHLEAKIESRLASLQSITLEELQRAGAVTGVVYSTADALEIVCDHLETCGGVGRRG